MKRAMLAVLIASLTAVPMFAQGASQKQPCAGLTSAQVVSLEHVRGEWRMNVRCAQGIGTIAMTDADRYRGDGLFAGWTQEKMREVYAALIPAEPVQELMQLG
jgi:hypothetical protein